MPYLPIKNGHNQENWQYQVLVKIWRTEIVTLLAGMENALGKQSGSF
jgi:hypothetical protein